MFNRIINNIRYDIKGNFNYILVNSGIFKALLYLSRKSVQLFKAIVLNKKKIFCNVEFYDTWRI